MTTMEMERSAEVLAGGRVRSGIARAHLQWVRDYHGDQAVEELVTSVPEEGWISFESLLVIHHAIPTRVEEPSCQCNGDTSCMFELRWS